jgi:bifunctional UDP-N-acetylglucosamine pyrophosphorylase/glucosamine-1-phosphate N-acetyltransferase
VSDTSAPPATAVILAAGKGTRMKCDHPKVLHTAAGRSLLDWVLDAVSQSGIGKTAVVLGHQSESVAAGLDGGIEQVVQEPQNGTGHAVAVALEHLGQLPEGATLVIGYGDMPLVPADVYRRLAQRDPATAVVMATVDPGPAGYGRIIRNELGAVTEIVEERDCTPDQANITERNAGLYGFDATLLARALGRVGDDNDQGELYLTDVIALLAADGERIEAFGVDPADVVGVNSHDQLAEVEAVSRRRINSALMEEGVWMFDPARTYVDADARVEPGVVLYPGTYLLGSTVVEEGASVGPDAFVVDSDVGADARVWYSVVRGARIGPGADVGPYASLRPGTVLEKGAKAGTFVETKNTTVGEGAKVPHLSYMGDAQIGRGANVGAGTITCNYDGISKHRTVIGEGAFIGSDTMLVAPVTVGDEAVTGAGSVITEDVDPGALAVERSPQRQVPGYADRRAKRQGEAREGP